MSKELGVSADRIFMNFDDVERSNWAMGGVLVPEPKALTEEQL